MVPHFTPMGGCFGHIREVHVHQFGLAVAAVTPLSQPLGPQIVLFKHKAPQGKVAGPVDLTGVDRPCINVKTDFGDEFLVHKRCKGLQPIA